MIFKRNVPYYYKTFIGHTMEESSLTCHMLPEIKRTSDSSLIKQKIIYGTHNDESNNYLIISSILLPNPESKGF